MTFKAGLTSKEVFVYAGQLGICLWGTGDDETVDDAFRDHLGHGMAQVTLDMNGRYLLWHQIDLAQEVLQDGIV
jgi:hypothetical protein